MTQQQLSNSLLNSSLDIPKRGKGRFRADFNNAELYHYYVKNHGRKVNRLTYIAICREFNEYMMKDIIYNGADFYIPGMGTLGIRKARKTPYIDKTGQVRVNHLPISFKATKELWASNPEARKAKRLVRMINKHTDSYVCRFYWDKRTSMMRNQTCYVFKASRSNQRLLAAFLTSDEARLNYCCQIRN